ncbi:MAG: arginine deiminase family protein [Pseudomonadota bacterium]
MSILFDVTNEFDRLAHVVMGTAEGYHRDSSQVEIVNGTQQRTVDAAGHPTEAGLLPEFAAFRAAMEAAGVTVHQPELAPNSVQDQTCPRDIGFVIGEVFVAAGMRNQSRIEELDGIRHLLADCVGPALEVPAGVALEGGDVVVDGDHVFVGFGQRSDPEGLDFLRAKFGEAFEIVPLPPRSLAEGEDVLHLDCAFNPLGLGHALIYPDGLAEIPAIVRDKFSWIEVTQTEATALATNVLSVAPDKIIARAGPDCARVNGELRKAGYDVTEVAFDGVPSTGGSFRCATMPLRRVR